MVNPLHVAIHSIIGSWHMQTIRSTQRTFLQDIYGRFKSYNQLYNKGAEGLIIFTRSLKLSFDWRSYKTVISGWQYNTDHNNVLCHSLCVQCWWILEHFWCIGNYFMISQWLALFKPLSGSVAREPALWWIFRCWRRRGYEHTITSIWVILHRW